MDERAVGEPAAPRVRQLRELHEAPIRLQRSLEPLEQVVAVTQPVCKHNFNKTSKAPVLRRAGTCFLIFHFKLLLVFLFFFIFFVNFFNIFNFCFSLHY